MSALIYQSFGYVLSSHNFNLFYLKNLFFENNEKKNWEHILENWNKVIPENILKKWKTEKIGIYFISSLLFLRSLFPLMKILDFFSQQAQIKNSTSIDFILIQTTTTGKKNAQKRDKKKRVWTDRERRDWRNRSFEY